MRTIAIQADKQIDHITETWPTQLVLAIPVGPHGIKFDGDLHDATIVNHRAKSVWTVSFRPSPGGSRSRPYSSPAVVARHHRPPARRNRRRCWSHLTLISDWLARPECDAQKRCSV